MLARIRLETNGEYPLEQIIISFYQIDTVTSDQLDLTECDIVCQYAKLGNQYLMIT